ncbi:copper resistance protein CopC (plasmid) [Pseudarthrobacter sp. P1]|uniref:copper resistance protein CopC n=1 Tax=Pseudarthrobacter sp. P1 TaxID=3418418 RepID=UPI003CE8EABC
MDSSGIKRTSCHTVRRRAAVRRVTQAVKPGSPADTYTVQWRIVSSGSHPMGLPRLCLAPCQAMPGQSPSSTW